MSYCIFTVFIQLYFWFNWPSVLQEPTKPIAAYHEGKKKSSLLTDQIIFVYCTAILSRCLNHNLKNININQNSEAKAFHETIPLFEFCPHIKSMTNIQSPKRLKWFIKEHCLLLLNENSVIFECCHLQQKKPKQNWNRSSEISRQPAPCVILFYVFFSNVSTILKRLYFYTLPT